MKRVILVGNPNTGKTTLFNCLTGANEHVGNWHGVTVEEKAKLYKFQGQDIELVDLPGIYSLTSLSFEEEVGVKYLLSHQENLVVNICDASNLQRNLYLTLGLLELGLKVILAVNQIDKKPICKIDYKKLSQSLGIPVVAINPSKKMGIDKLNQTILDYKETKQKPLKYIQSLELNKISCFLPQKALKNQVFSNFLSIKLLENDERLFQDLKIDISWKEIKEVQQGGISKVASARYDFIDEIIASCSSKKTKVYGQSKIDKIFLNRFLAFPIFIGIIALVFYLTFFSFGSWLSDLLVGGLDRFVGQPLISLFQNSFSSSWVVSFVEEGLIGGASTILGFLPQVALLFLFLSILEDSGYLSRVAFVFDDILSKVGLSGKSVYTLLMGFGCSTTAVLTARNMEDKNSKIKTGLLTPYMSCSAKFPIYAVLGGAFFGASNIWIILGLYFLGVITAILFSFILEKTILKSKAQSFILEFPPYHSVSFKRVLKILWDNIKAFLIRVGSVILAMNVIVWLLSNFSFKFSFVGKMGGSMLESLGKILSPIFIPLGFGSWGLVSALLSGLVAKEVIVSSIAMLGHVEIGSIAMLGALTNPLSPVYFSSPYAVVSYLVFCLLYFPCLATISVLNKEIGVKWTFFGVVSEFIIAYLTSFIIYSLLRFGAWFGWGKFVLILSVVIVILLSIIIIIKRIKNKKKCEYCSNCNRSCKN